MLDAGDPQGPAPLHEHAGGSVLLLVGGDRGQKVARIGETVRSDGAALRQRESAAVVLAEIPSGGAILELYADLHAARDDGDLARFDVDDPELGPETEVALLRDEQHLAVGIVEVLVLHRAGDEVHVGAHAGLRARVAGGRDRPDALDEGELLVGDGDRVPTHGSDRHIDFSRGRGPPETCVRLLEPPPVGHGRADAIEPRTFIRRPRRGEGRTAELLGIEAIGAFLGRVAPHGQCARQRLGFEPIAESGHVARSQCGLTGTRGVEREGGRVLDVH